MVVGFLSGFSWILECLGTPFSLTDDSADDFKTETGISHEVNDGDKRKEYYIENQHQPPPNLPRR